MAWALGGEGRFTFNDHWVSDEAEVGIPAAEFCRKHGSLKPAITAGTVSLAACTTDHSVTKPVTAS